MLGSRLLRARSGRLEETGTPCARAGCRAEVQRPRSRPRGGPMACSGSQPNRGRTALNLLSGQATPAERRPRQATRSEPPVKDDKPARRHPGRPRRLTVFGRGAAQSLGPPALWPGSAGQSRSRVGLMRDDQSLAVPAAARPANDHDSTILTEAPDAVGHRRHLDADRRGGPGLGVRRHRPLQLEVVQGIMMFQPTLRFAALEPISQAVTARFGGSRPMPPAGVSLRPDNRPQYTYHNFLSPDQPLGHGAELRLPAPATMRWRRGRFLPDPQRSRRMLGPNLLRRRRGQSYVSDFVARYNAVWRLERLSYRRRSTTRRSSPAGKPRRMIHPDVRLRVDVPPSACRSAGRRAQVRSSRAAGPRDSGLCLTGPRRWHSSFRSQAHNPDQPHRNPSPVSKLLGAVHQYFPKCRFHTDKSGDTLSESLASPTATPTAL